MTVRLGIAVTAPILAASIIAMGIGASQTFERQYAETLCRLEAVRAHALEQLENDEALTADFDDAACDEASLPAGQLAVEVEMPTPTQEPGATATPVP